MNMAVPSGSTTLPLPIGPLNPVPIGPLSLAPVGDWDRQWLRPPASPIALISAGPATATGGRHWHPADVHANSARCQLPPYPPRPPPHPSLDPGLAAAPIPGPACASPRCIPPCRQYRPFTRAAQASQCVVAASAWSGIAQWLVGSLRVCAAWRRPLDRRGCAGWLPVPHRPSDLPPKRAHARPARCHRREAEAAGRQSEA